MDSIPTILSRLISTPSKLTTRKDERTNELKEMKHSMNYYRGFKNLDKNGLSTLINSLIKKIFLSNIPVLTNLRAMSRLQMEFFGYKAGIPKPLAIAIIDSIKDKIEEDFGIKLMILKHRPDNYDLYTVNVNLYKQIWKRRFGTDDIDIEECVDNNRVACKLGVTQADIDLTHAEAFGFPDIAGQYYIMNDAKNRSMTGKRLQNDFRIIDVADSKLDVFFRYPKQLDQDEIDRWRTCSNLAYTFVDTEVINFKHI